MEIPNPVILFVAIIGISCLAGVYIRSLPPVPKEVLEERKRKQTSDSISDFEYEGCEYFKYCPKSNQMIGVAHKGNCKNPIHK